jgi:hypothetical protein
MAKKQAPVKKTPVKKTPFSDGDRVEHKLFGLGTVRGIHITGSGNWSTYVEFDNSHEKIGRKGRFAAIVSTYLKIVKPEPESEKTQAEDEVALEMTDGLEAMRSTDG